MRFALSLAGDAVLSDVAVAVFVTVVPSRLAVGRARIVTVAVVLTGSEPKAQLTAVWLPEGAVVHVPCDVVTEAKSRPTGSVSARVALDAVEGPLLRTWILKPASVPRLIVPVRAALLTPRTALGDAPASTLAVSLSSAGLFASVG